MKISSFIPGLSKAYESVRNVFDSPTSPYSVLQNHGVHHQCWYDIEIQIPGAVYESMKNNQLAGLSVSKWIERSNFFCTQVNVPAANLTTTEVRIGGGDLYRLPYTREYSPINISFYIDGGYQDDGGKILKGFQGWIDYIYPPNTRQLAYYDDYTCNVKVTLYTMPDGNPAFGKGGKEVIGSVIFHKAYPAQVEQLTLSGKSQNEPTEFAVTMNYKYFTTDQNEANTSILGRLSDMVKGGFRVVRSVKNKVNSIKTAIKDVGNIFK